jgi:hypothetical protein
MVIEGFKGRESLHGKLDHRRGGCFQLMECPDARTLKP